MKLNLHDVRPACLKEIFKVADTDGSGELDFTEFCTLIMAEDALPMAKARRRASRFEGGPWHPQGGRTMSTLAVTMRQSNSAQRLHSASDRLSTSPSMQSLTAIPMQSTFIKGKPFDRNMWVERSRMRRQEEQLATHQPLVRAAHEFERVLPTCFRCDAYTRFAGCAPWQLRTFASSKIQQMSYEEGMVAIKFYKDGGDAWKDWSRVHWKTRQPTSKPQIPRSVSMGVL